MSHTTKSPAGQKLKHMVLKVSKGLLVSNSVDRPLEISMLKQYKVTSIITYEWNRVLLIHYFFVMGGKYGCQRNFG